MRHAFLKGGLIGLQAFAVLVILAAVILVAIVLWPRPSHVYCGAVPRRVFSSDELHWVDSAAGSSHATYRTCVLRYYDSGPGLPSDTAMVALDAITVGGLEERTGWKVAANDCPLAEQDVERAFGKEQDAVWTALTWNGAPAACDPKKNDLPNQEVLVRGHAAYYLFYDTSDGLSLYL